MIIYNFPLTTSLIIGLILVPKSNIRVFNKGGKYASIKRS